MAPRRAQGPNNLQNFPIFVLTADGQTEGWLAGSTPDTTFRIDFFASAAYGPGGSGEAAGRPGLAGGDDQRERASEFRRPVHRAGRAAHHHGHGHRSPGQHLGITALRPGTLQAPSLSVRAVANQSLAFATQSGDGIAIEDPEAGPVNPVWGLTLSVSDGTLTLSSTAGLTGSGDGTGSLSYSGPLAALNAALEGLIFHPPAGAHVFATLAVGAQSFGAPPLPTEQFLITDGVFVVDTTADSGPGSLRQAILDANRRDWPDGYDRFRHPRRRGADHRTPHPPACDHGLRADRRYDSAGLCRHAADRGERRAGGWPRRPDPRGLRRHRSRPGGRSVRRRRDHRSGPGRPGPTPGLTTQLSLLDSQGQVLVQSDGVSSSDPEDLIAQQLGSGSYILKVAAPAARAPTP